MSKKKDLELMKLDLYEILEIDLEATEAQVKKAYRKKALLCHPDKNPDNPEAADEFDRLKKILEVLIDSGTRSAYDRVLKGRKAAALRARAADSKTRKLREDLEARERAVEKHRDSKVQLTEEERFRRELKRLELEGERIIADEIERLNREVREELKANALNAESKQPVNTNVSQAKPNVILPSSFKVRVKWTSTDDWSGYSQEELHRIFYKWGDINAVVVKQKKHKGTAIVDYQTCKAADMALQFEKGLLGKPVEVSSLIGESSREPSTTTNSKGMCDMKRQSDDLNYESIAAMNERRRAERQKLIAQMVDEDL